MCTYARKCVRGTWANERLCVHGKPPETQLCERGTPAHAQNSVLGTIRVNGAFTLCDQCVTSVAMMWTLISHSHEYSRTCGNSALCTKSVVTPLGCFLCNSMCLAIPIVHTTLKDAICYCTPRAVNHKIYYKSFFYSTFLLFRNHPQTGGFLIQLWVWSILGSCNEAESCCQTFYYQLFLRLSICDFYKKL